MDAEMPFNTTANLREWILKSSDSIEIALVEYTQRKNCVKSLTIYLTEAQLQLLKKTVFPILNPIPI